jgi:hypothetical protein
MLQRALSQDSSKAFFYSNIINKFLIFYNSSDKTEIQPPIDSANHSEISSFNQWFKINYYIHIAVATTLAPVWTAAEGSRHC